MPANSNSDIKELHKKTNEIALNLATFTGKLEGTLGHLATKSDIGEIVGAAIDRQFTRCNDHFQTKGRSSLAPSTPNTKMVVALTGAITAAISALVAVIYKLIGS